jgi:hypothetical protein
MNHRRLFLLLFAAVLLSGCESSSPSAPEATTDETLLEELAVLALTENEAGGVPLPSLERLLRETLQAIQADKEANAEGVELLKRARHQGKLAAEALRAGDEEAARAHAARQRFLTLAAILQVLGEPVAAQAVMGVDQALAGIEARFEGREVTERVQKILDRANALAQQSHENLDSGDALPALHFALLAADHLRSLSPRYLAAKAITHATRVLRAAHEAVKADPTQEETTALNKARRYLGGAREAFEAGEYGPALRRALESGKISLEVLLGRSGG